MNRKILLLNLVLVGLIGLLVWQLRVRRLDAEAKERATLLKAGRQQSLLAPPPPPPVPPLAPGEYIDTVQKMLFAKDRNPTEIIDVPPPAPVPVPKPPPPMPPLPKYYGQLHFGGPPVVELSGVDNVQKAYAVGEKVGEFTVIAFDQDTVTFEWNGQQMTYKISDLKPKDAQQQQQVAAAPAPPPASPSASVVAAGATTSEANVPPGVGADMGAGYRACKTGDTSPSGTVVAGYKKTISPGLMGNSCFWEQVK